MASLDEELNAWLSELPDDLKWPPQNTELPGSYYLLHSQYHAALILLHRPFVQYETQEPTAESASADCDSRTRFSSLSRTICADSAGRIVEIFGEYRKNQDLTQAYSTALAHAGSAATALMGEAILQTDKAKLRNVVSQLSSLKQAIGEMAVTYPPGRFMASIVDGYIGSISSREEDELAQSTRQGDLQGNMEGILPNATNLRNAELLRGRDPTQNPYSFTPTEAASHSVQGLPFLPSSFLEGLSSQDMLMTEQMGHSDYGFWEGDPGPA